MDIETKNKYVECLENITRINPNYKTAKSILGLMMFYLTGSVNSSIKDKNILIGNEKTDILFSILDKFTDYKIVHLSSSISYKFTEFNIPKETCEIIKRKYIELVKELKRLSLEQQQQIKKDKQEEIKQLNDNLEKML